MSDIVDLIDGAIRDFATSGDAMRWTPEPEQESEFVPAAPGMVTPSPSALLPSVRREGESA